MDHLQNNNFIEQIKKAARKDPNILTVYFFGSRQKGYANKESDLDIAIVVEDRKTVNFEKISQVFLPVKFPQNADISVVDKYSSPLFLYEIISGGKKIYVKNMSLTNVFEAYILQTYYDTHHLRNIYRNYLKESLEKGIYGYKA